VKGVNQVAKWKEKQEVVVWSARERKWNVLQAGATHAGATPPTLRLVFRFLMLLPGHAVTVAKTMGTEFEPGVLVHVPVNQENLFCGNMGYQALSRARDHIWLRLVGDKVDWSAVTVRRMHASTLRLTQT
jgi:hypothetical protein